MVLPLKLTQFYGHSIPRPRVYTDVKYNESRVDPPTSVNDALLSWASEAPWTMGGLSQQRLRGQGKLEGSASKLRNLLEEEEGEEELRPEPEQKTPVSAKRKKNDDAMQAGKMKKNGDSHVYAEVTPARKLRKMKDPEALRAQSDSETPVKNQREMSAPQVGASPRQTRSASKTEEPESEEMRPITRSAKKADGGSSSKHKAGKAAARKIYSD